MKEITSLRRHLRKSILRQSILGVVAMAVVLVAVTYFLGRYKAANDLEETAVASTKAFRGLILDGDIQSAERQLRDVLNLQANEDIQILNQEKHRIYKSAGSTHSEPKCSYVGYSCVTGYGQNAEILEPIFFDQERKHPFGYLHLSRKIQIDWVFLTIISLVFGLGYLAVFFGVTQITKSTMHLLVDGLESWSKNFGENPKDLSSFSKIPYIEMQPLKRAIEGLNKKIEEYETRAAEKAKLLLLRGIAHDILGPVAQVQLYLATLRMKAEANPELNQLIAETEESVQTVADIATQVKMLKGTPNPNDRIEVVGTVMREVAALRRYKEVLDKKIRLNFDDSSLQSLNVPLSEPELSRVLQNLVHNSVHASSHSSSIEIGLAGGPDAVTVSVRDHGHGIPNEIQPKVFQPDFTSKPGTGTGLGLSVVKYIVESRGGSVHLDSSPNGTVIAVTFPLFLKEGVNHGL